MHLMLADSIDGGIFMILLLLGAIATSVSALLALIPAFHRDRILTFILVAPALLCVVAFAIYSLYGYFDLKREDPEAGAGDILFVFLLLSTLPMITSVIALVVLKIKSAKPKP